MRADPHINLDLWIARNLAFVAGLQVLMSFVPPFVFGLLAIIYPLIKLYYWQFHSVREVAFCILGALLTFVAIPLFVQYCRYPRLSFGLRPIVFWVCSLLYVPLWVVVVVFGGEQITWPSRSELHEFGGILVVGAVLPAAHFLLSAIGVYASRHRSP